MSDYKAQGVALETMRVFGGGEGVMGCCFCKPNILQHVVMQVDAMT